MKLEIYGFNEDQKKKFFQKTNFGFYFDYEKDKKYIYLKNSLKDTLCKTELFTLYKCILYWNSVEKIQNVEINVSEIENDDVGRKKQRLMKHTHSVDSQSISKFLVDTDIVYSKSTNEYFVSFKKNGFYEKFDKINDVILRGWNENDSYRPLEKDINLYCKSNCNTINLLLETRDTFEDNCMVFADGFEYLENVKRDDDGKRDRPFSTNSMFLKYHLKILKSIFFNDNNDFTPIWVKDNLKDFFPLKSEWYTIKVDNVKKLESYSKDVKLIKHILNDQVHYSHGNPIGVWCYGPSGTGKSHTLYALPQQLFPEIYLKIKNIDPKWKEYPYGLHMCDDMPMKDRADYLHNRAIGELCPQRNKKPERLKIETLYPWHLSNDLFSFPQNTEAAYQLIRRYVPFYKGKKNIDIPLKNRNDNEYRVLKKILIFISAKYKSIMRNEKKIRLGDPTTYRSSPLLMQRYEVMKEIMKKGQVKDCHSQLYYFYTWIVFNTKKTRDKVGIDFRVLYKYYSKKYNLNRDKDAIEQLQSFGLEIRECYCDKIGKTITHTINSSSKNHILLIQGRTTIMY